MKSLDDYTVVVTPDDGTWLAYVPAIEGLHAVASTSAEARRELENVFQMIVEEYSEKGLPLPDDISELVAVAVGER